MSEYTGPIYEARQRIEILNYLRDDQFRVCLDLVMDGELDIEKFILIFKVKPYLRGFMNALAEDRFDLSTLGKPVWRDQSLRTLSERIKHPEVVKLSFNTTDFTREETEAYLAKNWNELLQPVNGKTLGRPRLIKDYQKRNRIWALHDIGKFTPKQIEKITGFDLDYINLIIKNRILKLPHHKNS